MKNRISKSKNHDIAIIGMAGIFPGADNLHKFWQNIMNQTDVIREVPAGRWRVDKLFDPDPRAKDKIYSKWGGFLEDIPFDPTLYGIPPVSLNYVEAAQFLALEITRIVLEDTGINQTDFPKNKTLVIFGAGGMHDRCISYIARTMTLHYLPQIKDLSEEIKDHISKSFCKLTPEWTEDSFPGILGNVVSGRVANRFDMMGSNYTVDAACASSLAAVDVAIAKLRLGQADAAIVGAVDMTDNVMGFTAFSKSFVLSPRGKSCPFDDEADGIVLSEGAAALVLKRLADAEKCGDRIHAVIKGIGSSSDGRNRSLTAPHTHAQVMAIERAYQDAKINPLTVGLIEAHGTGTVVGDKSEIEALNQVFGKAIDNADQNNFRCALGSIKSNIGHTKITAGLAGLIKGVLALEYQIIPPTMGVKKPNSRIDFNKSPLYLITEERPWFKSKHSGLRRCGVSAFGFGGTNFHVVLEEYPGNQNRHLPRPIWDLQIFSFSSPDRKSLAKKLEDYLKKFKEPLHTDITSLAQALFREESAADGSKTKCRLYIVTDSASALKDKLERVLNDLQSDIAPSQEEGIYFGEQTGYAGRVCFIFPGQGSQKVNMLRDILSAFPEVRSIFEEADSILEGWFERRLSEIIYPEPVFCEKKRGLYKEQINDTQVAQPAMAAADVCAMELLEQFGIKPDFAAGHSFGEYIALHAAGVISRTDLIRLAAIRGKLSRKAALESGGKMAAVQADANIIKTLLKDAGTSACAANFNSPKQVVIGGSDKDIDKCLALAKEKGLKSRLIPVTAAFHTAFMRPAANELALELENIEFNPPRIPVYSNTTGMPYPNAPEAVRGLLSRHIEEPLDFVAEIKRLYKDGAFVFIEVGPGKVLSGLIETILDDRPHIVLSFDSPGRSGTYQLAHLLAQAGALGLPVNLSFWFRASGHEMPDIETIFKNAEKSADPSPMTWRISNGSIAPWHLKSNDFLMKNPRNNLLKEDNRTMNEKRNNSYIDPVLKDSESLILRIQANLDQFIELQQNQQRLMDRFLDLQQQLMTAALNGNGSAGKDSGVLPAEKTDHKAVNKGIHLASPPAPSLPKLMPINPSQVKPHTGFRPVLSEPGKKVLQYNHEQIYSTPRFQADLLRIVSEQTGYPENMLDLDANLEADLGIDSIKRVEIFSLLGDHHQLLESQREEMVLEELADLKSLRKIIEWYDKNRMLLEEQTSKKS